jgi:transcription elongation factor/antiterminator RfaH
MTNNEHPKPHAAPGHASQQWYVVRAKPRRERFVVDQLSNQGLEVFYPAVRVHPVNPRAATERAYFPGYLFVHLDLAAVGVNRLRWLPAAVGLLEFGGEPATVPEALVTQLKRRVASIQAAGGLVFADLKQGDAVEITSGPFAGYEAIFDLRLRGADRVRVLLELLRRQVPVELDSGSIRKLRAGEAVSPAPPAVRSRRSRS